MSLRRGKRQRCPHCDEVLCYKSFFSHKRRYFDETTDSWITDRKIKDIGKLSHTHHESCTIDARLFQNS